MLPAEGIVSPGLTFGGQTRTIIRMSQTLKGSVDSRRNPRIYHTR